MSLLAFSISNFSVSKSLGILDTEGEKIIIIPWQGGKPLVWDATVVTPLASSYVDRAATGAGVVSDLAADRKLDKYSSLSSPYTNQSLSTTLAGLARQRLHFFMRQAAN